MTLETILRTVLHAIAWSALVAFCGVVVGVGVRWMLSKLGDALAETGRRCGKWAAVTLASLALVCAVVAQKANTNAPSDGVSAPAPMMSGAMETIAPPVDWAQSSPAGALSLGAQSSRLRERPATAQDVEEWKLRGAYDGAIRIPADGWDFRMTNGFIEGLTVFSRGEFRPDVGHLYFPRPFTNDLAFLPQSRWGLLPSGGESKLWFAATPSNSLLVTWVNGLLDRNPLTPTNFQAEFFPDGSYEYRYGETSLPREPVMLPFDWDGDGLENTVDPDPFVAGPDAHNTNDEWYGIVCSNVFDRVVCEDYSEILWRDDVCPDAYYFVDVVVDHGPTPIYFNALNDGGDLGSPVVVATGGVTNHVPLLLGVTYAVTSDVPVTVSLPEDCFATVTTNDALNLAVSWPLECWFMETGEGTHAYYVGFNPRDPGGVFSWSWENDEGMAGASLMSGAPDLLPRCFSAIGNYVWADCDGNCGCGGCQAEGTYWYAGRTVTISGGDCGCVPHPPPPPPEPVPPSVFVSFSDPVVFYEDEYDNTPTNHVDRQSTTTVLSVYASGGTLGTTLSLSADNLNKLTSFYGTGIPSFSYSIPPSGYVYFTVGYEGAWASGAENDVTVSATVADRVNGGTLTSCCSTTVVKVELRAFDPAPANPCMGRHVYGVGEWVGCYHVPGNIGTWTLDRGRKTSPNLVQMPFTSEPSVGLRFNCLGREYRPTVELLEPSGILAVNEDYEKENRDPALPGGIVLKFDMYVLPAHVLFSNIDMVEVPWYQGGEASGYYNRADEMPDRYHGTRQGAGKWRHVSVRDGGNFWAADRAGSMAVRTDWIPGTLTWDIPIGWNAEGVTNSVLKIIGSSDTFQQKFHLSADGAMRIEKHGHWVKRTQSPNPLIERGDVWLDGILKEQNGVKLEGGTE